MSSQVSSVPIANSEMHYLTSVQIGQKYEIKVRLPEKYYETAESYPVLYLLDGDYIFAMATDIVQYLIYGEHIPDLIIVSPSYGSKNDPENGGTNMRGRDLLPFVTPWTDTPPGGVEFLRFITEELMPFVGARYRVKDEDRALAGYSAGAIFALYSLFQKPGLFQRMIAIDGLLPTILEMEEAFSAANNALPVKLHLSDGQEGMSDFADTMAWRDYAGFTVAYSQLGLAGHFTVPAEGLTKGMVSVFQ